MIDMAELFSLLGGIDKRSMPYFATDVRATCKGTPYITKPCVALTGKTWFYADGVQDYLNGFDHRLGFREYFSDPWLLASGAIIPNTTIAVKHAGQGCYGSWGPNRTSNAQADSYIGKIKRDGHWSVLEHATFTFFLAGSRTMFTELNRHRGLSISQLSQRYVSKDILRFVERPEFQKYESLHERFLRFIDFVYSEYDHISQEIKKLQEEGALVGANKTSSKKNVQQAARAFLLGCTESSGYWTGNARTWRHVVELRTAKHTIKEQVESSVEPEIREVAIKCLLCLHHVDPILFGDYTIDQLKDGSYVTSTSYKGA